MSPWRGLGPPGWGTARLKRLVELVTKKADRADLPYIGLEQVEPWTGRIVGARPDRPDPSDSDAAAESMSNQFQAGDVLFGKLRPYLAKAYRAQEAGCCSSELLVLRPEELLAAYLKYVLLAEPLIKLVDSSTFGAKMPRADWEFIGRVVVPVPPLRTQRVIADFLDGKTAALDALIEKKERVLGLLGQKRQALVTEAVTPGARHWAKTRLAWILREVQRPVEVAPERRYAEIGVRSHGRGTFHKDPVFGWELDEKKVYWVEPGDLVFNIVFAWERAVAIVQEVDRGRIASHRFPTYRAVDDSADMRFIRYLFMSDFGRFLLDQNSPGAAGRNRTLDRSALLKEEVWVPPLDVQRRIANELDSGLGAIDRASGLLASQIGRLREYRQALITAAVTGQIDVSKESAA